MEGIDWGRGGRLAAVIWLGRKDLLLKEVGANRFSLTSGETQLTKYTIWGRILNSHIYLTPPLEIVQNQGFSSPPTEMLSPE